MLRYYQRAAVDAIYRHLQTRSDNPCVVLPTGAGKTYVIATICRDIVQSGQSRIIVLAHVKELLVQTASKLDIICPDISYGIYSAGLSRRDTTQPVIIAGIQSVYQRASEIGPVDIIVVDESHLLPPDGDGMYRQFISEMTALNPQVRVVGLTATPYRLRSGNICTPDGVLNSICYNVSVRELITRGYLCPLVTRAGQARADLSGIHIRNGEYASEEAEGVMSDEDLVNSACDEIVEQTKDRNACLIFATGVSHAQLVVSTFYNRHQIECGLVTGESSPQERDKIIKRFVDGSLKYLCNVNVLTTGFDAPNIDCIALLRPTLSPGLYYQMVGRGLRLHHHKTDCLVLDFAGNALRHGPIDQVTAHATKKGDSAPAAKECPDCRAIISAGYATCPHCGYTFPQKDRARHSAIPSDAPLLSSDDGTREYVVQRVSYHLHIKRDAPPSWPKTMRVEYLVGRRHSIREWISFERPGYARKKAEQWWAKRCRYPAPSTAKEAVEIALAGQIAEAKRIRVKSTPGKLDDIVDYELGPLPPPITRGDAYDDDLPWDATFDPSEFDDDSSNSKDQIEEQPWHH